VLAVDGFLLSGAGEDEVPRRTPWAGRIVRLCEKKCFICCNNIDVKLYGNAPVQKPCEKKVAERCSFIFCDDAWCGS
jgi:hypothetical protein